MQKRGISPLIATVLLVGFTVALSAVVITWGTQFIQKTQEDVDVQTETGLSCADVNFDVTSTTCSGGSLAVHVKSNSKQDVSGFILRAIGTTIDVDNDPDIDPVEGLGGFGAATITWTGGYNGDATSVEVIPKVGVGEDQKTCSAGKVTANVDCIPAGPVCGNGIIEGSEVCECGLDSTCGTADDDLNGETCITKGFDSGILTCSLGCLNFDTGACELDPLLVFATVTRYEMVDSDPVNPDSIPEFIGIAQADAFCQSEAIAGGFSGTYKAWLSTDSTDAKDTVSADREYENVINEIIASGLADLIDGSIGSQILRRDENSAGVNIWTGTYLDGTKDQTGTQLIFTCSDWSGAGTAVKGNNLNTNAAWTNSPPTAVCTNSARFYCFEQPQP